MNAVVIHLAKGLIDNKSLSAQPTAVRVSSNESANMLAASIVTRAGFTYMYISGPAYVR